MTRFIYIADTHFGAAIMGYQQQRGYPEKLSEILASLRDFINADGSIDFVLHGGDMIDSATDENIAAAVNLFDLPVPVYLCLGNHDLTTPQALDRWLTFAPNFFHENHNPEYSIVSDDCVVHVVPNQWETQPYYWNDTQDVHFSKEQSVYLSKMVKTSPHLPHIILTHSSVLGLPMEQTGFDAPYHSPNKSFEKSMIDFVARHSNVKCVLGAHSHMNMRIEQAGVEFVTVSSLTEIPFEFKLFDLTPQSVVMTTVSLTPSFDFNGEYNEDKAFVQGRSIDRAFTTKT